MRFWLCLIYFFLLSKILSAQTTADFEKDLKNAASDTTCVRLLLNMSDESQDIGVMTYANKALDIINKNLITAEGDSKRKYLNYKAQALHNIGDGYSRFIADDEKAIKCFTEALEIYEQTGEKNGITNCFSSFQRVYIANGDLVNAKFYINKALAIQFAAKDSSGISETYASLAALYDLQGKMDSALYYEERSLQICKGLDDKEGIAYALDNLGTLYLKKGDVQMALDFFYEGLNYCEKYLKKIESNLSLMHIGNVYNKMNDYSKALEYYRRSLNLVESVKLKNEMPAILDDMGFVYRKLNKPDSAFMYYNEALKIATEINSKATLSLILTDMGEAYLEKGDTATSINFYRRAIKEVELIDANDRISDVTCRLGNIFFAQGKTDSAFLYGSRALKLSEESQVAPYIMHANYLMSRLNKLKGNYRDALNQYSRYILFRDSIDNKKNYRTALTNEFEREKEKRDLIAKTEQQKKQIQIDDQRKIIWISSVAFVIIIALGIFVIRINQKRKQNFFRKNIAESQMKALRAQMNPHFIFNSLNAIQQMVLSSDNDNAFRYLDTYSKLTRKILENSDKQWISVEDEITFLELYLSIESLRFSNSFSYRVIINENVSKHFNKVPPMIIQPYVENAIKHGLQNKRNDQKIVIDFALAPGRQFLEVMVEDNGVGRAYTEKLKAGNGHNSKGMMITEQRIQLQNGSGENKVEIEDLKDDKNNASGTRVKIIIAQPS